MTTRPIQSEPHEHLAAGTSWTRWAGIACFVAGILGGAGGLYLALRNPAVGEEMWTYPQRAGAEFAAIQVMFAVTHVGMILGLLGLRWCGAVPRNRPGRIGLVTAVSGMALLTLTELVAISVAGQTTDSDAAGNVGALYGVATIMIGLGMIVAGVAAVRHGAWSGWQRWVTLVTGAWLFLPTMPALVLDADAARLALLGWGMLFALLGWLLWQDGAIARPRRVGSARRVSSPAT